MAFGLGLAMFAALAVSAGEDRTTGNSSLQCGRERLSAELRQQILKGYYEGGLEGLPDIPPGVTEAIVASCQGKDPHKKESGRRLVTAVQSLEAMLAAQRSLEMRFKLDGKTMDQVWSALSPDHRSALVIDRQKKGGPGEAMTSAVAKLLALVERDMTGLTPDQQQRLVEDLLAYGMFRATFDSLNGSY